MAAHTITTGDYGAGGTAFPFAAIAGMDDLKLALLLNAVSPAIGGVLVRGEKGTAKSTLVRGLAGLLPPVDVVEGCRFSCDPDAPDPGCPDGPHQARSDSDGDGAGPGAAAGAGRARRPARLAELPVGATEDRLAGSLDIERALTAGVTAFEPGLLAAAHRGILYVDEVNLLHDHLVDLLLDAAALGVNYVEREGVSVRHAARFLLVGTMNPEEGELRPQLLDRFGLTVEAAASRDPAQRAEVVRRRLAYEADPAVFAARWAGETARLAAQVAQARERLGLVLLPDAALDQICAVCASFEVDGLRADLVTARTAIALAAWHGRAEVGPDDIRQAARLALPHRRRRDPFDAPGLDEKALDEALEEALSSPPDGPDDDGSPPPPPSPPPGGGTSPPGQDDGGPPPADASEPSAAPLPAAPPLADQQPDPSAPAPAAQTVSPSEAYRTRLLTVSGIGQGAPGRRSAARTPLGRQAGARRPVGRVHSVHLPATLRAAAHRLAGDAAGRKFFTRSADAAQDRIATYGPEPVRGFPAAPGEAATASRRGVTGQAGAARREKAMPATAPDGAATAGSAGVAGDAGRARRAVSSAGSGGTGQGTWSLRAAWDGAVGRDGRARPRLRAADLRESVRIGREGNLVLFVVDASGSMAAGQRMRAVKGAVGSLLRDAYQRRDKVGLITFRGTEATLALPPTSSVEAGARRLAVLPTGGRTPLAAGLALAVRVLAAERLRDPDRRPLLVVVTDGRATSGSAADLDRAAARLAGIPAIVVDCETGMVRLGLANKLAIRLGAVAVRLDELAAGRLAGVVRAAAPRGRRAA
jgi:magnesium chelatase subunit D